MTEPGSDPDRPRRSWLNPPRLFGRVRTSTVLIGVCFILTALLYDQVRPEPLGVVNGPTAVDTSQYQEPATQTRQPYVEPTTTPSATTTAEPSTTVDPSGTGGTSGTPGASTGGSESSTTQDPTYLPGITIPPELRSLLPAPPSATGTP